MGLQEKAFSVLAKPKVSKKNTKLYFFKIEREFEAFRKGNPADSHTRFGTQTPEPFHFSRYDLYKVKLTSDRTGKYLGPLRNNSSIPDTVF